MYKNLINGRLVEGKGKEFTVYNPENGKAIQVDGQWGSRNHQE